MELFLNLLWVLLALPAFWVWLTEVSTSAGPRKFQPLRTTLILASALILLFPVISATDDLHAMRPDMEESSGGKRTLSDGAGERTRFAHANLLGAVCNASLTFAPFTHVFGWITADAASNPASVLLSSRPGRGPPSSILA